MTTEFVAQSSTSDVCDSGANLVCELVLDATGSERLAQLVDWLMARPLKIVILIVLAVVANRLVRRAIQRAVDRMVIDRHEKRLAREESEVQDGRFANLDDKAFAKAGELLAREERSQQRARTLGSVLQSTATATIYSVAALIALSELDINLGPLIAGAGIIGIAIGFGAQSLVQDFLTGVFMIIEDQYGVGDVVNLGEATGIVEQIGLRTTRIRDVEGTVWFVPNGQITRVANKSQLWARSVLDIEVAYDTDIEHAKRVIKDAADEVWHAQLPDATILEEPEIWGVERFGESAIAIRLVVKTEPGEQWIAARAIRQYVKEAFDAEGIVIPFPQRVVWTHSTEQEPEHSEPVA